MIAHSNPLAGYLAHKREIEDAIARVLASGSYILGEEVCLFEEEFAKYIGCAYAIGTGNGTDAIELALRSIGVGAGDAVVTVSNTAVATVAAIELTGASAVLVDVNSDSLTMSVPALESVLASQHAEKVKALLPVHLYGCPADMTAIMRFAESQQLPVIEDCAQAHGASRNGKKVGSDGVASAFSFYPTKNLGALGDGGAVLTNSASVAERAKELRTYGWKARYISERPGKNTRLDELQAAILRVKLRYLDAENARRREIAAAYDEQLGETRLVLPPRLLGVEHVYHQYVVRTARRDALRLHLTDAGIQTGILYPQPIHQQPAYKNRIGIGSSLAVTERAAEELLCLPIHPWLKDNEVEAVCEAVRSFFC